MIQEMKFPVNPKKAGHESLREPTYLDTALLSFGICSDADAFSALPGLYLPD